MTSQLEKHMQELIRPVSEQEVSRYLRKVFDPGLKLEQGVLRFVLKS